jgi:hypothetical protein
MSQHLADPDLLKLPFQEHARELCARRSEAEEISGTT